VNLVLTVPLVGNVAVTSGPLPISSGTAPGPYTDHDTAASASVSALGLVSLGTGLLDTHANSTIDGLAGAKSAAADATVDNVGLNIFAGLLGLTADEVQSTASITSGFNSLNAVGSTTLTNAALSSLLTSVGLGASPAPNTHVDVLGLFGLTGVSLILNEQIQTGDGVNGLGLAVNAIHLGFINFASGLNVLNGDIIISHSEVQVQAQPDFRLANPVIQNPQPVDFGNVRIHTPTTQTLSILNDVPNDGFSEKLNASAGPTTGGVTAGGAFTLLAPQAVNNTAIQVGLDTTVAGDRSGTATLQFASDGTGTSGAGQTPLPSQDVQVTGAVYRLADPVLNTSSVTLLARVGDPGPSAPISLTNASPDQYTEGLKASPGAAPAGFTAFGGITNLAAGATDTGSLGVSLDTSTAGTFGGNLPLNLASTGAGTTGAPDFSLPSQDVGLNGKVYTPAVAQVNTPGVDFGIVHVGDAVAARPVSVTNAAPVTALNDVLLGSISASGPFAASGNLGAGLGAGNTDPGSLTVSLNTGTAGVFGGNASLSFASHDPDLADLNLGSTSVTLSGQVKNYANGSLLMTGGDGSFTQLGGHDYLLDFGNVVQGSGPLETFLAVLNDVLGPADLLDGQFDLSGADDLVLSGFSDFVDLAAGQVHGGLGILFTPSALGLLDDTIILRIFGHNDSGYRALEETLSFRITGNVVSAAHVPEPGTLVLDAWALMALLRLRRRAVGSR
jgi:hypothetical protein